MFFYNSRDELYKSPYGSCPSGGSILFRVKTDRGAPRLCIRFEAEGNRRECICMAGDGDGLYSLSLRLSDYVGLLWYHFEFNGGSYGVENGKTGGVGREYPAGDAPEYRVTVYRPTPASEYGRGITYHIFADRFYRTRVPNTDEFGGRRRIHENWEDTPEYRKNHDGKVENSDFFGGNIAGIIEKLDYLASLNVGTIYLSPIFEASENHRYNTGDYLRIDRMLGNEADFSELCRRAAEHGMKVMLDGVFSHTGADSLYFNLYGNYGAGGAARDRNSRYYNWYSFERWPDKYSAWWGVPSLPQTDENNEGFRDFIIRGEDSVIRHWMRAGASGWRLDVADELPDDFIHELVTTVKKINPEATVIGEVWEDASDKISYDTRRKYLTEDGLDGVMNYVFRDGLVDFMLHGKAEKFAEKIESLRENYPKKCFYNLMNSLGTHDTERILTVLGTRGSADGINKDEQAGYRLDSYRREEGIRLVMLAAAVQICFPGSPCIYYGDEAGLEGFGDPFNRMGYPWGREDAKLLAFYRRLTAIRAESEELKSGGFAFTAASGDLLAFVRTGIECETHIAINRGGIPQRIADSAGSLTVLLGALEYAADGVYLPPLSFIIYRKPLPPAHL